MAGAGRKERAGTRVRAMTAGQVARQSGVAVHTVRWYLRQGLLLPRRNPRNGYYEFTARDLQTLNFVQRAKALGFTLKEIDTIFEMSRRRETPCPLVHDIVARRLIEVESEVAQFIAMQRRMQGAILLWRTLPDGVPDGNEICRLIEAVGEGAVDLRAARKLKIGARRSAAAKR